MIGPSAIGGDGVALHSFGERFGNDVDASSFAVKFYFAVDQREQRVVLARSDTGTGVPFGPALPDQDIARSDGFTAKLLHATSLSVGIAAVAATALTFLMCHRRNSIR